MIKLLLAGSRSFTDQIQKQAKEKKFEHIRIIKLTTEPSSTVEALEDSAKGVDAVLLGFSDDEIKILVDVATRNEVQSVIFVSVENMATAYRRWAQHKLKLTKEGRELETIIKYFGQRTKLLKNTEQVNDNNIFSDLEESSTESNSQARIEKVIQRENSNRAVTVKQKVITIFGQKGGIGKSVIGVSMAKSIACLTNLKVIVLDLDMNRNCGDALKYFGHIGQNKNQVICNFENDDHNYHIPTEKTLAAWSNFPWELRGEQRVVENYLIQIKKNIFCLPPMRTITEEQDISYDLVRDTIGVLKRHFDVIIIDGGNTLSDPTLSALENCDELIIVSSPELSVLDNLVEFTVDTLKNVNKINEPLIVINNRAPLEPNYNLEKEIPKITGGSPLTANFPYDQALYEKVATKAQVPYLGEELTPFLKEMERLLKHIFPRELLGNESKEAKSGFLKKIFSFGRKKSAV